MARQRIAVIGAGGCAREVAWTLRDVARSGGELELAGYVVSDPSRRGATDHLSSPRLRLDDLVGDRMPDGFVLGVGSPALRAALFAEIHARFPNATWPSIIHPTVQGDLASASIGDGVVVCAGSFITVNVHLAAHVLVHYGSILSHESSVGSFCTINPGCAIAGAVTIEEQVMVGLGARIIQNIRVGARAVIGAGAVVIRDVPPDTTVVGVPARPLRSPRVAGGE